MLLAFWSMSSTIFTNKILNDFSCIPDNLIGFLSTIVPEEILENGVDSLETSAIIDQHDTVETC